jgi:hypothetical protein
MTETANDPVDLAAAKLVSATAGLSNGEAWRKMKAIARKLLHPADVDAAVSRAWTARRQAGLSKRGPKAQAEDRRPTGPTKVTLARVTWMERDS